MEKAVFGMDYLNITQGMNGTYSHQGTLAIDIAGKNRGIDDFRAPFTGIIKRIYTKSNVVWLESIDKVLFANGDIDYMTISTGHDNDVSNLKIGQVIKQNETYYQEGIRGNATGNHIHLQVGKGKYTKNGWYKNSYGKYVINNQINVNDGLFLNKKCKIINDRKYNWRYTDNYLIENNIIELQNILNKVFNSKLPITGIYDSKTIKAVKRNNMYYKKRMFNNEYVKWIQTRLNILINAKLKVDGIFGSLTKNAVNMFQEKNNLVIDGIVGTNTVRALSL